MIKCNSEAGYCQRKPKCLDACAVRMSFARRHGMGIAEVIRAASVCVGIVEREQVERDEDLMRRALEALELSIPLGSDVTANLELTKDALRKRLYPED